MTFNDMREFAAFLQKQGQLKEVDVPLNCARGNKDLQPLMR